MQDDGWTSDDVADKDKGKKRRGGPSGRGGAARRQDEHEEDARLNGGGVDWIDAVLLSLVTRTERENAQAEIDSPVT
jgi:hypothetical protein